MRFTVWEKISKNAVTSLKAPGGRREPPPGIDRSLDVRNNAYNV